MKRARRVRDDCGSVGANSRTKERLGPCSRSVLPIGRAGLLHPSDNHTPTRRDAPGPNDTRISCEVGRLVARSTHRIIVLGLT